MMHDKLKTLKKTTFSLLFLLSAVSLLQAQTTNPFTKVPSGTEYQYLGTYDLNKMYSIFYKELEEFLTGGSMTFADFKGQFSTPKYPVKLYRVYYNSVIPEFDNKRTLTSGLVAIPDNGKDSMPMVSYQHGTVFGKDECPSNPDKSMETRLMIAQFASQGYIVIGADYFGLGVSDMPNSYLVRYSSEQACLDMLYAAKDVLAALKIKPGSLFLHGWSQGGWTNMTFLRKLEEMNIPVTAASTASAPVDAFGTTDRWVNNYQPIDAVYIPACFSNYLFALEYYCQMPGFAATAIRPQYYQTAKDFYNWKISWTEFRKITGDKVQNMLQPSFMETGNIGSSNFWQIVEKSDAYRWRCHTPLNNYYGESDEVVPVYVAKLAEGFHHLMGSGDTHAISAGAKADHRATYVYSVIHAKPWFDGFLKQ